MVPRSVYTIQPCSMPRRLMQNHICRVHACLAVTCHRHFWQNDRDLLHAIAVPRWWNGYRNNNNSQHRKLTPEKKLLPLFLPDSNPQYFDHESGALTTELPPPPPPPRICRCIQPVHLPVLPSFTAHRCNVSDSHRLQEKSSTSYGIQTVTGVVDPSW